MGDVGSHPCVRERLAAWLSMYCIGVVFCNDNSGADSRALTRIQCCGMLCSSKEWGECKEILYGGVLGGLGLIKSG